MLSRNYNGFLPAGLPAQAFSSNLHFAAQAPASAAMHTRLDNAGILKL
jgi:hypothetical protein